MGKRGDLLVTGTRLYLEDLESVEMPVPVAQGPVISFAGYIDQFIPI